MLQSLFAEAVAAVRGDRLVATALKGARAHHVIALGKAAEALAHGAWRVLGDQIDSGFMALPKGYETGELSANAPFERHIGAHPLPDDSSLAAGAALARYATECPDGAPVTVLVSGGASACVEHLVEGVDLALLRRVNAWALRGGLAIDQINAVRARFSQLKGGGLARWLQRCEIRAYVLSDVLEGGERWVGGSPLVPVNDELPPLPGWLQHIVDGMPQRARVQPVRLDRLGGNSEAVRTVCEAGAEHCGTLTGDTAAAADELVNFIEQSPPGLYVWGSETTIKLPRVPREGGRCRHLALAVARSLAGREDWTLLAAGTDGWDGTDGVAGVCVDGRTIARGKDRGRDASEDLHHADSGGFFVGSDERIVTGPTGTNVNDLVILLKR
jgi:hydroxypyruvate reductase